MRAGEETNRAIRSSSLSASAFFGRQAFWGKGIATQALTDFLKLESRPLHAHVAKTNIASIRVLEKCGFKRIGEDNTPLKPGEAGVGEWIYERAQNV